MTGASSNGIVNRRIGLTGGSGFVGSALVDRLIARNEVRVLDLGIHDGARPAPEAVDVVVGDVRDGETVQRFMDGCDIVIHLASIAGVASVISNPVATMETVMLGAHHVLRAARARPELERLVFFSTSEVAGRFAYQVGEDQTLNGASSGELRWTYAAAKLASEFQASSYHAQYGVPVVSFRPFNIYGPGQVGSGAIREFVTAAIEDRPLRVNGDGSQIRAWCYIADVVDAVELACVQDAAVGQVFNVGNPRSVVTVAELARLIVRLAESESEIAYVPYSGVDVELRVPDITKARELLGFEPKVDLDDGILSTIDAYRESVAAA